MVGTLSTGVTGVPGVRGDTLPLPLALLEKSRGWFSSGGVRKLERGKDCLVGVILASIWSIVSPGQTDHDCGHRTPLPPETAGHTYGSLRAALGSSGSVLIFQTDTNNFNTESVWSYFQEK